MAPEWMPGTVTDFPLRNGGWRSGRIGSGAIGAPAAFALKRRVVRDQRREFGFVNPWRKDGIHFGQLILLTDGHLPLLVERERGWSGRFGNHRLSRWQVHQWMDR